MRRISPKSRWMGWFCCAVVLCGGVLLVPGLQADATAEKARVDSGVKGRAPATKTVAKPAQPKARSAKAPAKSARKVVKKKKRPAPRAAKAPEKQALDVATGPDDACHIQLRGAGVSFVKVKAELAPDVRFPIRLTGAVAGVEIQGTGKKVTHYLDCRLGLALVRWAPQLKAAGVTRIDHYSIYRPDAAVSGTSKTSGHALAMAIDAGRFHLSDGRVLTVLDTWADKTKGADPCSARPLQSADEQLLRELVCSAARSGIFQTIVTPNHNPDHDNHVHLEVSGSFAPTWIR